MRRAARPDRGFTLIELLIVIAIIGLLAAMLIPNLLDALQKAKQKKTMADERIVGTAMMSRLTDQTAAAAAGQANTVTIANYGAKRTVTYVSGLLVPQYIAKIPELDGWKVPYDFRINDNLQVRTLVLVGSTGDSGNGTLANSYTPGAFDPTDYAQDIVWTDGFFVRWPQKLRT